MEERLRAHIDELFGAAAATRRTAELKEEMVQNLTEKYHDLLSDGKTPEAAYSIAVASIGDISPLLRALEYEGPDSDFLYAQRQRSAMFSAIAVMLYILSVLPLIITQILIPNVLTLTVSLSILFAVVAAATGILVYNNMTRVKSDRIDTPEAKAARRRDRNRKHGAVSSTLWIFIVIAYFLISFRSHAWHITWIIFLVGAAIESLMSIFIARKNDE